MNSFGKQDSMVVKGTAILMMLFYHLYYDPMMYSDKGLSFAPFTSDNVQFFSLFLNICVNIFLFLSVYGFYVSLRKMEEKNCLNTVNMGLFVLKRYVFLFLGFCPVYVASLCLFRKYLDLDRIYGVGLKRIYFIFLEATGLMQFSGYESINMSWWYLKVLISVIVLMPFLYAGIRKWKALLFFPLMLIPYYLEADFNYSRLISTVLLALICGEYNVFERLDSFVNKENSKIRHVLSTLALLILTVVFVKIFRYLNGLVPVLWRYAAEGFCTLFFVLLMKMTFCRLKYVKSFFAFLGKHSMNMYFVHLFFMYYCTFTKDLIFGTGHFLTVYLVVTAVCLLFSIALELLKKLFRYPDLIQYVSSFFDGKMLTHANNL